MSVLWSPSAENACDSLMTVSRMLAPWPRRLSAAVLMNEPNGLTPPGSVGCSVSVSFSSCSRNVVPLHRNRGAVLRDHRVVGHHRPAGVGRGELDGARGHQRRRQDHRLGVGGHLVLAVVPERDLDPCRAAARSWSILPTGTPRMRTSSPTKMPLLFSKYATTFVRLMVSDVRSSDDDPGDQQQRPERRPSRFWRCGLTDVTSAGGRRRHFTRSGHDTPDRRRQRCGRHAGRRRGRRSRRRAAGRRRGQRLAVRVAAGGPGSGTPGGPHP